MIIAVFGKIGSGKTTVCNKFVKFHPSFKIINADLIAKELLNRQDVKESLKKIDKSIITSKNQVDRKYLRKIIFANKELGEKVDMLLWPMITEEINQQISNQPADYIIEVALLNQLKLEHVDLKIKVKSNIFKTLFRVIKRDNASLSNVFKIWWKQTKLLRKTKYDISIRHFYELEFYLQKNKLIDW
ncbi:dephospho-CoA kinase [Mycoplasma putrefaciens]|uniref:Dephospho-CoA kinase n=1 Tax=Mycoplasma putrefaciens Mput9231 TaxID=1292033 RepID=M9W9Q2_9MOLU|nr:dephospho-CoA kinase [Mycoplasma putrefaciens]AGJ90733.1 Dephospho-CoA kinase [Mycoplasma putrefaciens Mput9231]